MSIDSILRSLQETIQQRSSSDPKQSWTAQLHNNHELLLKKLGEEAIEVIIAAQSNNSQQIVFESADLLYHLLVLLNRHQISLQTVVHELAGRSHQSGVTEKAKRTDKNN